MNRRIALGLDIGSLFIKLVILDENRNLIFSKSLPHRGEIVQTTRAMVREKRLSTFCTSVSLIGRNAGIIGDLIGIAPDNEISALIHAVQQNLPGTRHIIDIGGSSLSLIDLDDQSRFTGYQTNTLCAAGTGSFLDEQAIRLGVDYHRPDLFPMVDLPPAMATRCAVFAKSDLIHRQQEGYSPPEMWSGICKSMARTITATLFKGRNPRGKIVVTGGVALNPHVMEWLNRELSGNMATLDYPQETGAYGAALLAGPPGRPLNWNLCDEPAAVTKKNTRPPLLLKTSHYPSFEVETAYTDLDGNAVRITQWPEKGRLSGYIGVDAGSTSTKLLMIDENENVILDIYRQTNGNPLKATASLFAALRDLVKSRKGSIQVLGVGTTGSGRKLVGRIIGADTIVNEITAHLKGAITAAPEVDTIFEIGGQDSKYIRVRNGNLCHAAMNYVCAAGTGSFIEEACHKTGQDLTRLGDDVMGVQAPFTSDRCTVFMDQDIRRQLRKGWSVREVMGGVLYSVAQNYLNKVVGHRHYSRNKILFQGATARNKGLVAAFENLLGVPLVVSPYCHVMGSWGAALFAKQAMAGHGRPSAFSGLSFSDETVRLTTQPCRLCANQCNITFAQIQGLSERLSWGYVCGRDPDDPKPKKNEAFKFFQQRNALWGQAGKPIQLSGKAPVIAFPRALLAYSLYPFWQTFFAELGFRLRLSKQTDDSIKSLATDWVGADYCYPVKLAHGHVRHLMADKKEERIFVPHCISADLNNRKTTQSYFCPYNMALPTLIRSATQLNAMDDSRLLTATADWRWDDRTAAFRLFKDLGNPLGITEGEIRKAWRAAMQTQKTFNREIRRAGQEALAEIRQSGLPALVMLGRPYNIYDPGANLALPEKIAGLGFRVLPLEFLNLEEEDIGEGFGNMFWDYGRKILEAAKIISRTPFLYAVYLNNFGCGPDSFIQSYVETIMGEKPMLMLELDEHGADAGYITRIEAFADVIRANTIKTVPVFQLTPPRTKLRDSGNRTLWLPPMGEGHPEFMAAILRNVGIDAQALPLETHDSFLLGRANTRGGECTPCPATMGAFIAKVKEQGGDHSRHALFMPTSSGPCRFGQYCVLNRMVLDRLGWTDVPIISWTSEDSYAGLDLTTRRRLWTGIITADILFKMRCRIRPYEIHPGRTEDLYCDYKRKLVKALETGKDVRPLLARAGKDFLALQAFKFRRPLVGIVGEIYVRNNRFINRDLIRKIEETGGEVWLTPISEWILYTTHMENLLSTDSKKGALNQAGSLIKNHFLQKDENSLMRQAGPILDNRHEPDITRILRKGERFLPMDFKGEAIITIGRAISFIETGADLVINCAPFGCMPGTITSGVFQAMQNHYQVPMVSLFFDGEDNDHTMIEIYLANLSETYRSFPSPA